MTWTKLVISFALFIAVAVIFVHLRATAREQAAEAAFPPDGQFVTIDGRRVHAVVTGTGPDLVLIHGSSGNTRDFTHSFVNYVSDRYRVIIFDRPGLGWSDRLPVGAEGIHEQAAQLRKAAAALGANKPIVLGQSYGAAVALAWALDAPQTLAAVVNVSGPSHPWDGPLPLIYRINAHPIGSALVVPLITAFVSVSRATADLDTVFAPQAMPKGYVDYAAIPLTLKRSALRANASQRASLNDEIKALAERYPDFPVPMEIVHGDADVTVSASIHAAQMIEATDMANLTLLPGIGHMPHHVAPREVADAIDRAALRARLR